MQTTRWSRVRLAGIAIGLLVLYWSFSNQSHYLVFSGHVSAPPEHVWEFVADFSNVKKLNPTVIDFSIESESGNFDHWRYAVRYTERLSQWPHWMNVGLGHFSIKPRDTPGHYVIESEHETCFWGHWMCSKSVSEFHFKPSVHEAGGTECEEQVHYQCPGLFASFCRKEVLFQRKAIMENLVAHFKKLNES